MDVIEAAGGPLPPWAGSARDLLGGAQKAWENLWLDLGWRYVHAAERYLVHAYPDDRLEAEAVSLREEAAEKLGGWRLGAVNALLAPPEWKDAKRDARIHRLQQAFTAKNEFYAVRWMQRDVVRAQLVVVMWIVAIATAALALVYAHIDYDPDAKKPDGALVSAIILSGILGGGMSAFFTFAATDDKRISENLLTHVVTLFRTFFGGAAALAVFFLLDSPIADSFFEFELRRTGTVLFVSFSAGFSERLLRRGVEKVAG